MAKAGAKSMFGSPRLRMSVELLGGFITSVVAELGRFIRGSLYRLAQFLD